MGRQTGNSLRTNIRHKPRPSGESWQTAYAAMGRDWLDGLKAIGQKGALGSDLMAGLTVAAVALPLNVALAMACGLPPSAGLIAGAIGGIVAAFFGGAALQITGPAAAINLMVFLICRDFGAIGVAAACLVVGVIQIIMALALTGRLVRFVPEAVLAGFTTGVGLKLLNDQIGKLLGHEESLSALLVIDNQGISASETLWLHEISWHGVVCGLIVTLLVMTFKPFKKFPAALLGMVLATAIAAFYSWDIARVGTINAEFPVPSWPKLLASDWLGVIMAAIPLGLLAGIESLISASAVDRMIGAKRPHNSNLELVGQGLANLSVGFVSGMPVSGVIVRSSVNVQCGARSRLSGIAHGLLLLGSMLFLGKFLALIPVAALAGLLCVIACRLIEGETFWHLLKEDRYGSLVFLVAVAGTVTGNLMAGLSGALVLYFAKVALEKHKLSRRSHGRAGAVARPVNVESKIDMTVNPGIRAIISGATNDGSQNHLIRKNGHNHDFGNHGAAAWIANIRQRAQLAASTFVHNHATVIGRVVMGRHVHIAADSSVRADEGAPFFIGDNTNIQDGVVLHALKEKWVRVGGEDWAIYLGRNVSVAHQALVHGPCYVGDKTFIGFKAVVHDSIVGANCFVGIGAVVVGVEVPAGRYVPNGSIVDNQAAANALPPASEAHHHFNDDVVEVNKGLAVAYTEHAHEGRSVTKHAGPHGWAGVPSISSGPVGFMPRI